MASVELFKEIFRGVVLEIEDIYLLEPFQIAYLPGWIPEREFASVLEHRPEIEIFLRKKCPEIEPFLDKIRKEYAAESDKPVFSESADTVLWTIADILVYSKCPEVYDSLEFHEWDFSEIASITSLTNRIVIDAGSGTGRVALEAAEQAEIVYAVEPVPRLRQFIRQKAALSGISNLYVMDGFLDKLPFPDSFADVLITSHALGWRLEDELKEFERVVKEGGSIIHCPGSAVKDTSGNIHDVMISCEWGYRDSIYDEANGKKRKYWKQRSGACPQFRL
ncbi:MAG: class I SAM-dependent methyltransferase [Candidatus Aegiribacteria sp.]|nr:class I SAM-dependent methyltransferase [Candidatus Aegiribacteria sp.]